MRKALGAAELKKRITSGAALDAAKGQDTQNFTKVAGAKSAGSGDGSAAFAVTGRTEGDTTTVHGEVVRHGATVATYYSVSLAALAGRKDRYGVPAETVKAQAAVLRRS
ncbi:hypothetical protein [Streptomyces guryensis]|uniref:Uncharacterized protein n=1 Tax=Streptomyces guryensis TaxID=2886947 RepID=A0A9Q3Z522_9ACTN|nr:hypothetical protein [Streptomyces guryensis]MCD9873569.1 hypothetical protein [Streptomyces guryensis]